MKNYIFCPNCSSGNTYSLDGTNYRACLNCGRMDFEGEFKNRQAGEVPVKFHENIDMKHLETKKMYARGQYDDRN